MTEPFYDDGLVTIYHGKADDTDDGPFYCPHGEEVDTPGGACYSCAQEDAYDGDYL